MNDAKTNRTDPIKHVIVLMLENRSFDQMLGALQKVHATLDGIDENAPPRTNTDTDGNVYEQRPDAERIILDDPPHELDAVLYQIEAEPAEPGNDPRGSKLLRVLKALWEADKRGWLSKLWGDKDRRLFRAGPYEGKFVETYAHRWPLSRIEERQEVINYFALDSLPALHKLARHFTICDHWFSSVPGPTWANRFFFHSGTSLGTTRMPEANHDVFGYDFFDQPTIYNRLSEHGRTWRIYFDDIPQSMALSKLLPRECKENFSIIEDFEQDVSKHASGFPDFVFIEPGYMGDESNDDHPPHDTMLAQKLISRIYNGLRANEELWNSSMFIVLYDEHGGFYDHVQPPATACPDDYQADYRFDQLGVRVPAVLVSPWVKAGVCPAELDHTSVGKYLCDKFGMEPLGERMATAISVGEAVEFLEAPRADTPYEIPSDLPGAPRAMMQMAMSASLNENQQALLGLSEHLDPTHRMLRELPEGTSGATQAQVSADEVRGRVVRFLGQ